MKFKLTIGAFALASALASFGATRAVTPMQKDPSTNGWWMVRHAQKMDLVRKGGSKVVFLGDSITHNWEGPGKAQWQRYFAGAPYYALDLGYSGDRTENVLWRITEGGELDGYEAKVVVLMIGTNNAGHSYKFPDAPETPMDTISGIRLILDTIKAKQPKAIIVLHPIFPRGAGMDDPLRKQNEVVNKEIWKFADGKTVFWCDFNDQMLTAQGCLPKEVMPDLLHPRAYGYELWAAAVKPYIDYALSDGKLPIPPNRFAAMARPELFRCGEHPAAYPDTRVMEDHQSRGLGWWEKRFLEKRNQIADAKGEIDLVFAGDSITHYWETKGADSLAQLTKRYSVLDIGYGGDRTEHLLWRLRNGELTGYKAKCVMLMIGTNNASHRKDPPEETAKAIKLILDEIRARQPQAKVLLVSIFPIFKPNHISRTLSAKVNTIIKGYADGENVIWVDFYDKFLDKDGLVKWCMPDEVHPNAEAYRDIWLPAVQPYFEKILGK